MGAWHEPALCVADGANPENVEVAMEDSHEEVSEKGTLGVSKDISE